jgi:hypothetical protein
MLGPLLAQECLVSLREALGWMAAWPANPPGNGETILIGGLETWLEVLEPAEAEAFLRQRLGPFIREFQQQWGQGGTVGLVFGFGCKEQVFEVDIQDEVSFKRPGGGKVRLSANLWNGAAKDSIYELRSQNPETGQFERGGFHVRWVS